MQRQFTATTHKVSAFLACLCLVLIREDYERLPFEWNTRKFRGEFKWNGSSRWKFFRKKVILFEVLPFSRFYRNDRNFLYYLSGLLVPGLCREKAKNLPVFCKWYNSIPFLFSVPKKIPVPLDGNFSPAFPYKW